MKLDVNVLRYLSKEDFRVLTAVEMGQKNVCTTLDSFGRPHMQQQQLTAVLDSSQADTLLCYASAARAGAHAVD